MSTADTKQVRVAIIGAGPAGLTLAALLQRATPSTARPIDVTVFESETSSTARLQGGTLDLHEESGLLAIREAGLWEEFREDARYDELVYIVADKAGKTWMREWQFLDDGDDADDAGGPTRQDPPDGGDAEGERGGGRGGGDGEEEARPEIDRAQLRAILLSAVRPNTIRWGCKLQSVTADGTLHFSHGTPEGDFDLVVGADGAWSKVRPLLTATKTLYSGIGGFDLTIPLADTRHPAQAAQVGQGTYAAYGGGKTISAQRLGDGSLRVYAWGVRDEDWRSKGPYATTDLQDLEQVHAAILEEYADWAPELRDFIRHADGAFVPRNLYMHPVGHTWPSKKGFTLVGDAAHLMTPFAGEGVNAAMQDALELSRGIVSAVNGWDEVGEGQGEGDEEERLWKAVQSYESAMHERMKPITEETEHNMHDFFFQPDFPSRATLKAFVKRIMQSHGPPPGLPPKE
ncbi:MAG: hypothetical protein M1838_004431 [Thelocarpon superellum]|nr:MAG: hypothetical protein M1838_004431 [Thelocarpon superellum]